MCSDLVIPFHDIKNYIASMDQNKPMEDKQSYLGMNSMAKTSMACLTNMDDVLTEDFHGMMHLRLNCFPLPSFPFFTSVTLSAIEGHASFSF